MLVAVCTVVDGADVGTSVDMLCLRSSASDRGLLVSRAEWVGVSDSRLRFSGLPMFETSCRSIVSGGGINLH